MNNVSKKLCKIRNLIRKIEITVKSNEKKIDANSYLSIINTISETKHQAKKLSSRISYRHNKLLRENQGMIQYIQKIKKKS